MQLSDKDHLYAMETSVCLNHHGLIPLSTNDFYMDKRVAVRVPVMITCALSIIGSLLIVLSFMCFKDLRSRGRQILVNISIMDLGVASFNLIGASVYFGQYYTKTIEKNCTTNHYVIRNTYMENEECIMCPKTAVISILCLSQAFFSTFFTLSSILWTNSLSFYLYFRIVHNGTNMARNSLWFSYVSCYCLPLLVSLWLLFTGRLGYSPYESMGWCSIIMKDPVYKTKDIYVAVFGYNLWIALSFVLVPLLSLVTHCYVRQELKTSVLYRSSERFKLALFRVDYKFIMIPVAFIVLRLWSFLEDVLYVFSHVRTLPNAAAIALMIPAGIGDSGQGITNAIMFVLLTKEVRRKFLSVCTCISGSTAALPNNNNKTVNIQQNSTNGQVNGEKQSLLNESSQSDYSHRSSCYISRSLEHTPPNL